MGLKAESAAVEEVERTEDGDVGADYADDDFGTVDEVVLAVSKLRYAQEVAYSLHATLSTMVPVEEVSHVCARILSSLRGSQTG